ncbi:hypothetical protein ACQY0O_004530 [Thecaphora frezii]
MPLAAFSIVAVLTVESWKASSRLYYRRKSRKHGYADLPTDSYGRPINERGEPLTRNQAKALIAHNRELERIRTAEREWRLQGEKLPNYEEARNAGIREALRRPRTAQPGSTTRSVNRTIAGSRATSWGGTPTTRNSASPADVPGLLAAADDNVAPGSAVVFSIRRNGASLAVIPSRDSTVNARTAGTAVLAASASAPLEDMVLDDVFQNDGMDWQRATWEGSPIYSETDRSATLPPIIPAGGSRALANQAATALERRPSQLII